MEKWEERRRKKKENVKGVKYNRCIEKMIEKEGKKKREREREDG